ncbi:unnamed protein product, partial [marine sediment metagenome]
FSRNFRRVCGEVMDFLIESFKANYKDILDDQEKLMAHI